MTHAFTISLGSIRHARHIVRRSHLSRYFISRAATRDAARRARRYRECHYDADEGGSPIASLRPAPGIGLLRDAASPVIRRRHSNTPAPARHDLRRSEDRPFPAEGTTPAYTAENSDVFIDSTFC